MDSWTLQGDSYSFLRSAPTTFSLCHRDGTPNHIEIFDIINTPTQRSAISETTCLCDIFGDERECQSLSSSPATGTFAPFLREVDGTAAASPLVDDLNESSSSYHTAPGSSEGEEGFEDSREKLCSPTLQGEHTERKLTEDTVLSKVCEEGSPNLDLGSKSPTLQQSSSSPSSQFLNSGEITPSSGHTSPHTVSTQGRLSALSYSSVDKRHSPSFLESQQAEATTESRGLSPISKGRHSSLSHQSLPPSPSFEPTRVSLSLSESGNREQQKSPEARKLSLNHHNTPSPEGTPEDLTQYLTESTFEARSIHSSPLPSPYGSQSLNQSRESVVSPEFRNTASLSDFEASSPLSELEGRISLPDLLSRGSTPDIEESPHIPAFILNSFTPESLSTTFSEPADPNCAVSPFTPQYIASSPVIPVSPLSSEFDNKVSSRFSSPTLCFPASSTKSGTSTPSSYSSPKPASPGVRIQVPSPEINYSLTPSPVITVLPLSPEFDNNSSRHSSPTHCCVSSSANSGTSTPSSYSSPKSASPGVRIQVPSPEINYSLTPSPVITALPLSPEFDNKISSRLSSPTSAKSRTSTPSSYSSPKPVSPGVRIQVPSPDINYSLTPSPAITALPLSPEFDNNISSRLYSPTLCCAASSANSETNTPSFYSSPKPASPGVRIQVPSPEINYSLTPSPVIPALPLSPEFDNNSSRLSSPTSAKSRTSTPSSYSSTKPLSPGVRIQVPSPEISLTPSPVITALPLSPEFDNKISSPLSSPTHYCVSSSANSGTSTPSFYSSPKPASPGVRIQVPSPEINHSLTPSPAISDKYSPTEYRHNSPSPEIRIITSESEVNKEEVSSERETTPSSPFLEPYSYSSAQINPTSSPHFTGICYSVVQPEDRNSPPFPELSHLSAEEPDSTLESSVGRSLSGSRNGSQRSIALSTGTAHSSPHTADLTNSEAESENTQSRYQRDSPLINYLTPSPDVRYQSPSPEQFQISTPEQRSTHQSPAVSFSEQHSSSPFTTNYNPDCTSSAISAPEVEREFPPVAVIETQFPNILDQNGKTLECIACDSDKPGNTDSQTSSPFVFNPSVSNPPGFEDKKVKTAQKQQEIEEKYLSKENIVQEKSSSASFPDENLTFSGHICQAEETYSNHLPFIKSTSPNLTVLKKRSSSDTANSLSPTHSLEDLQTHFTPYSTLSESTSLLKPYYTPQISRKQLLTNYSQDNRTRTTEGMSRHVERRRTPSPPLTRFTPIHILAPEKPYRHWQNSSHSHSQVVVPSQSRNSNKAITNRECPDVAPVDIYSQGHRAEPERQLEREQQLVQQREVCRERQREHGMKKERKREEQFSEKGEGWPSDASYRGEQVELSFSARNRKGPASCSAAPTSRESRRGLPTVHSHSESFLATRQPQQQQHLFRGGGASRRHQPHNKSSASGHFATKRPSRSSSSSMGSELDETDNEVKWFSDVAFRSLSSPEIDYLDMYNSSHRSSTNISQPSTQESPAGVKSPWLSYAEFKGSTAKLDQDELACQHSPANNSNDLDSSRCFELGSFECVDVAVEREDSRKLRRGVPKRQIQLKRRNAAEGIQDESSENSSPGIPVLAESPSQDSISRVTFLRQHSTPDVMQECYPTECSPEHPQEIDIKSKLQKSASVEESCTKTKNASHLIKNVLSKKMQSFDNQSDEQREDDLCPDSEDDSPPILGIVPQHQESQKHSEQTLSSSLQSDYSLSSEGLPLKTELTAKDKAKPPKGYFVRPSNRSSSSTSSRSVNFSMTGSEEVESQNRSANLLKSEMRSELKVPFDSDHSGPVLRRVNNSKTYEREDGDTASTFVRKTDASSPRGPDSTQARVENKDQIYDNIEDSQRHNIIPKTMENKKASLNVCLTPEAENQPETSSSPGETLGENGEIRNSCKNDRTEDPDESNAVKAPLHKVRDVRRLVKNTYNLSFKAATIPKKLSEERTIIFNEERREVVRKCEDKGTRQEIKHEEKENKVWMERKDPRREETKTVKTISPPVPKKVKSPFNPHPMQIQCKAVCWKEDKAKTSCFKRENTGEQSTAFSNSVNDVSKESLNVDAPELLRTEKTETMLENLHKMPSKEREISTAVVLIREGPSQTTCSTSQIQDEIPTPVEEAPALMHDLPSLGTGGHSVSMLLKEKGYQADIGAVMGENQKTVVGNRVPQKHVNRLEIPLQTNTSSCGSSTESHKEKSIVSASKSGKTETITNTKNGERSNFIKPMEKEIPKENILSPIRNLQKDPGDFEAVKRLDPTFPPKSPAIRRFKPQPIQALSLSKEPEKQGTPSNLPGSNRPQSIEVKSIAKNPQKPVVPPKPSCKFKPTDLMSAQNDAQRQPAAAQAQTIVVSSPTIYRKISNEAAGMSNYSRKLAVSTVSSLKPPPHKSASTTLFNLSNQQSTTTADTAISNDGNEQCPQSSTNVQKSVTLATAPTSGTASGVISAPSTVTDPKPYPRPDPASAEDNHPSQTAVIDPDNQLLHPRGAYLHEQSLPVIPKSTNQPAALSTTQVPRYLHQPFQRSLSSERSQRADDLRFMASDDPPSYDERESFSPLTLPDLTPLKSNRYQPTSRRPQCSCTAGCHTHPGLSATHPHCSPHNLTPPAPPHSPGQTLPYPAGQPPLRPHQCRPEPQHIVYQPGSPKASSLVPSQPPTMLQPLHQSAPCPPHPSLMQSCSADRSLPPLPQHIDPRRPPVHRSPHQQLPNIAVPSYSEPGQNHSPGMPSIDHQYLCGPQSIGPSYGSEYGGDSSSLYSESSYAQTPRRVLLDPETGKYFYIEVPVQPLRKMLFDPETGQYVEVLIPQQAMSHSALYPPSAAPYPPLHNPNMYAHAPQYMPYTAPPPSAHPQAPLQPPRYPEASVATMHPPGLGYRNPPGQGSKSEPQSHPPLDHSYLESMYYVPTGMNASPNPTPPDYYHKHPPNLPPTGGKRS